MKLEEINNKDIASVHKLISVLKYLNTGATLNIPDLGELTIAETNTGGFQFCLVLQSYDSSSLAPIGTRIVGVDFEVVINAIEQSTTKEDILMMAANIVLNQINKKDR